MKNINQNIIADPFLGTEDLVASIASAATAFSSAIHEMQGSEYRSKNEPNPGEGIVLKNIDTIRRRAKAHNRKKNRR